MNPQTPENKPLTTPPHHADTTTPATTPAPPSSSPPPIALITGAARRVGRAIALELAKHGFDLHLTYNSSRDTMLRTADTLRDTCPDSTITLHHLDLTENTSLEHLQQTLATLDRLDALIHNASTYAPSPFGSVTDEQLLHHYRANAAAPALLTQHLTPQLSRSILPGGGSVICFSDIHVLGRPRRNHLAYAMSKAALTEMIRTLALNLAPAIRINAIAPGVIAWPDDTDPSEIAAYEAKIPLSRPGTPEDAARLTRWLITEATYITGEIIRLDGGRWLR